MGCKGLGGGPFRDGRMGGLDDMPILGLFIYVYFPSKRTYRAKKKWTAQDVMVSVETNKEEKDD